MGAQDGALLVDDLAGICGTGAQLLDHRGIVAVGDKADVLAVGLVCDGQAVIGGQGARFGLADQMAQGKAQEIQLFLGGREQEIALIAVRVGRHVQFGAMRAVLALDVMAGRHAVGFQQVAELDPLVAADAGNWRRAGQIGVGEFVDDRFAELVLVIQDIMGKAHAFGHATGIVDVLARAARAFLGQCRAVVIQLQRDPDDIISFGFQLRRNDGTVHAPRHRHDDTRLRRGFCETKAVQFGCGRIGTQGSGQGHG